MLIPLQKITTLVFVRKIIHCLTKNVTCVIMQAFARFVQEKTSAMNVNLPSKLIMEAVFAPNLPLSSTPNVYLATYQTVTCVRKQMSVKLVPISSQK